MRVGKPGEGASSAQKKDGLMMPRTARSRDAGFTLIETMVALGIAMVMFAALGAVSIAGLQSVVLSRQNQQAADVLNRAVEQARSLPFGNLSMKTTDLGGDPAITGTPPTYVVPGGIGAEPVEARSVGAIAPHITTESPDGKVQFGLRRYVTRPASATTDISGFPSVVRFTAVVSWSAYGKSHSRTTSTLITDTRRGLPLPNYLLQALAPTSKTQNPNTEVTYAFTLRNLGARDAFNITASSGAWSFYIEDTGNETLEAGADPATNDAPMGNFDAVAGNSDPDTGQVEPNRTVRFYATRTIGSTESGTSSITFTATSIAQPLASGGTKAVTVTLTVQTGSVATPGPTPGPSCPSTPAGAVATGGTTLTSFFLTNRPVGTTSTTTHNAMARAECTVQGSDNDFSSEDPGRSVGRVIRPGGNAGNVASNMAAEWRYQVASNTLVQGTAVLQFKFRCTSATGPTTSGSATFQAMLGERSNDNGNLSGFTAVSSATTASLSCPSSGWATVNIPIGASMTVNKNKWIAVRLVTSSTSSRVLVNYDSPNAMSFVSLPVAP